MWRSPGQTRLPLRAGHTVKMTLRMPHRRPRTLPRAPRLRAAEMEGHPASRAAARDRRRRAKPVGRKPDVPLHRRDRDRTDTCELEPGGELTLPAEDHGDVELLLRQIRGEIVDVFLRAAPRPRLRNGKDHLRLHRSPPAPRTRGRCSCHCCECLARWASPTASPLIRSRCPPPPDNYHPV